MNIPDSILRLPVISFYTIVCPGIRQHRHLVDRARRRHADAAAVPAETAPHLEELQDAHLHRRADGRQLYTDEERSEDVPLPAAT